MFGECVMIVLFFFCYLYHFITISFCIFFKPKCKMCNFDFLVVKVHLHKYSNGSLFDQKNRYFHNVLEKEDEDGIRRWLRIFISDYRLQ